MRILQINSVVNYGSTGKIVQQISSAIEEQNWDSYIAFGRHLESATSREYKIGSNLEILTNVLGSRIFDNHALGVKRGTKNLIKYIRKISPDIIHIHNLHGYYINIAQLMPFLASLEIPIVMTLHDCWSFTGHCAHFDFLGCNKWKTHCGNCPQERSYPSSLLFDRSEKNYNVKKRLFNSIKNLTLVPVSEWLDSLLEDSFLSEKKHMVIKNGIDTDTFVPSNDKERVMRQYNISGKYIILGVASKWTQRKGLNDILQIADYVDKEVSVVLVGDGIKNKRFGHNNVIVINRTDSAKELAAIYSAADLYINPTYEDTLPTTNIEAIACGTPVLTYNTGGCSEIINDSTGFLVEKGNINQMIEMIQYLYKQEKWKYSDACRERAIKYFNKDDRFLDYIRLYKELMNGDIGNEE